MCVSVCHQRLLRQVDVTSEETSKWLKHVWCLDSLWRSNTNVIHATHLRMGVGRMIELLWKATQDHSVLLLLLLLFFTVVIVSLYTHMVPYHSSLSCPHWPHPPWSLRTGHMLTLKAQVKLAVKALCVMTAIICPTRAVKGNLVTKVSKKLIFSPTFVIFLIWETNTNTNNNTNIPSASFLHQRESRRLSESLFDSIVESTMSSHWPMTMLQDILQQAERKDSADCLSDHQESECHIMKRWRRLCCDPHTSSSTMNCAFNPWSLTLVWLKVKELEFTLQSNSNVCDFQMWL